MKSLFTMTLLVASLAALSACGTVPIAPKFPQPPASLMKPPVELSSLTLKPSTTAKLKPSTQTPSN